MRRYDVAVVALGVVGVAGGAALHTSHPTQYTPEPSPTTTIPEGAVGTCQIEGISPAYDGTVDAIVGVDVFLRCAETTERTTLHELHIAGVNADALQNWLELVVPATSQPVTPQVAGS